MSSPFERVEPKTLEPPNTHRSRVKRELVGIRNAMRTILVGYDASGAAERVLDRAAELAEAFSARLVVVSVATAPLSATAPVFEPGGPTLVPGAPLAGSELEGDDPKELAQRLLEQARASLASRGLDADYVAEVGSPAERLLVVADERDAELIVVGHGEHGFLERLVMQPVEEAVARRARRDVLIVH
jgi:nucleotide-binding universal stress UspA family protein